MIEEEMDYEHKAMAMLMFLENELIHQKRYFAQPSILGEINKIAKSNVKLINQSKELYRGRIFKQRKWNTFDISDDDKEYFNKLNQDASNGFFGYNAKESGAPPPEKASNGRANPKFIPYLYMGDSQLTCVAEVRPFIGETVSVAKAKATCELKLVDFSKFNLPQNSLSHAIHKLLVLQFSKPIRDNSNGQYMVTQYIAEYIKTLKYDGICYRSSLFNKGINYLIFDPKKVIIKCSALFYVRGMLLEASLSKPKNIKEFIGIKPQEHLIKKDVIMDEAIKSAINKIYKQNDEGENNDS